MPRQSPPNTEAMNECDTNADTCCLGSNFALLQSTSRTADVYGYSKDIKPIQNVPIVTGVTAYDCPDTNVTHLLIFNEALYYGSALDHSLINPNQVRSYGIPFWDNPFDHDRGLCIECNDELTIQMQQNGTKTFSIQEFQPPKS